MDRPSADNGEREGLGVAGKDEDRSFWSTLPGLLTAVAATITAIGGLLGILYATGVIGSTSPSSHPNPSPASVVPSQPSAFITNQTTTTSPPPVIKPMIVNMSAQPEQVPPRGTTSVIVEVLSAADSPIVGAYVAIHLRGGSFAATGGLDVTGTTNVAGFFSAPWTSPDTAPVGQGYYITATITQANYEDTTKRISVVID